MIDAAVVVPVYRTQDGALHVLMIRRNAGGVHGGQIAFPGGKYEPQDETMLDTALREVREELGLSMAKEDVLAELPMEQTRTTGYRVFPYLARITAPGHWRVDEREIAELFDMKLTDLIAPGVHDKMMDRLPTWRKAEQVFFYRVGPYRLWGLSYRILHALIPRLVAGEWDV